MAEILDWRRAANPSHAVRTAVQALTDGKLVAFPTETVYGIAASALLPEAVERLRRCKGRPDDKPWTLTVAGAEDALDWVPGMSRLGRRLARRCWPGPVTLVYADGTEDGLVGRLPEQVRQRVSPTGSLGLRTPAHQAILQVMRLLPGPLVLTSANRSGEPDATTVDQVVQAAGDQLALVIDDGPSRYGKASTVVEVKGESWKVLREGIVSERTLQQLSCCMIVFVCTGNTCRSPLAEALCKKLLAERLGCTAEELPQHGFLVLSAGLAAIMGGGPAHEAVQAARELGVDLGEHMSQPLTQKLATQADYLVAMTRGHLSALADHFPGLGRGARLLDAEGGDIPDPIGCDQQVYHECAQQILHHLETFVREFQQP